MSYLQYMRSDEWAEVKHSVFKRDDWKCQYCGSGAETVHHIVFDKWQNGGIDNVESICFQCLDDKYMALEDQEDNNV